MKKTTALVLAALTSLPTLSLGGCASPDGEGDEVRVGTVSLPLIAVNADYTYRLLNANLSLTGPESATIQPDPNDVSLDLSLLPGDYSLELQGGWQLERTDAQNNTVIMNEAALISENPLSFSVVEGKVTNLVMRFDVTGTAIEFGEGGLHLDIEVCDVPGTCNAPTCEETPISFGYSPLANQYLLAGPGFEEPTLVAQTFVAPEEIEVSEVVLPLWSCKSNGIADARLRLTPLGPGGVPEENTILAEALVANDLIADSCVAGDVFEDVIFDLGPVTLSEGSQYALILEAVPVMGNGDLYWRRSSTPTDPANPYPDGSAFDTDLRGEFSAYTNLDLDFLIVGNSVCE